MKLENLIKLLKVYTNLYYYIVLKILKKAVNI